MFLAAKSANENSYSINSANVTTLMSQCSALRFLVGKMLWLEISGAITKNKQSVFVSKFAKPSIS